MIAQTFVNINAGSRARLSGIVAALTILMVILVGAPFIEKVPMAALVGVMVMVAISTFNWVSCRIINKMPKSDILVGILVALITIVLHNLALAVLAGVVISSLVFAWESAKRIRAKRYIAADGKKHYEIYGPLFFGSVTAFMDKFDVEADPSEVLVDFKDSRVADMSGIEALNKLTEKYRAVGKQLTLIHLSEDCRRLLANAEGVVKVNVEHDPTYYIPSDRF